MSDFIPLPHKPEALLSFHLLPGQGPMSSTHLVIFLNGLIAAQDSWQPTIADLQRRWAEDGCPSRPPLLTYDRFGQGHSARDPADTTGHGVHGIRDVVRDLHALALEVWEHKLFPADDLYEEPAPPFPRLVFVANSIGCVVARLYAMTFPGTVEALLLLDSNIANSDLVSIFPDPDAPSFDPAVLPRDVTVEDLRRTRKGYAAAFRPDVPNPEHLDRRDIAALLPEANAPKLVGPGEGGHGPWIVVVGHDWDTFADEGLRGFMHVPKSLTNAFMNPAWTRYNEGLTRLTDKGRARGPLIAVGCGHFIHKDDPGLVAGLLEDLLEKLRE